MADRSTDIVDLMGDPRRRVHTSGVADERPSEPGVSRMIYGPRDVLDHVGPQSSGPVTADMLSYLVGNYGLQNTILSWCVSVLGSDVVDNIEERCMRFLEEAFELVQSLGLREESVAHLLQYVYKREKGKPVQELGGVVLTLNTLASVMGVDLEKAGFNELVRAHSPKVCERIKRRQAEKQAAGVTLDQKEGESYDYVNHPKHYNEHPGGIECIDVIEHMSLNVGTTIKYLWRGGLKPSEALEQDMNKALWYLLREMKRLNIKVTVDVEKEASK